MAGCLLVFQTGAAGVDGSWLRRMDGGLGGHSVGSHENCVTGKGVVELQFQRKGMEVRSG